MPRRSRNPNYEAATVKSAERTLDILVLLARSPNGLKLRDIVLEMKIPVSSLYALLTTMKSRGFVEREKDSLLYRLTQKVYQIVPSNPSQSEDDLYSVALPIMDRVQRASDETVSLSVRVDDEIVFIGKRASSSVIQVVNALGSRLPVYATGSGKVILSYLTEEELDRLYPSEILPRVTANTILSRSQLKKELAKIQEQGYAYDNEESIEGVWAVAGCIHDMEGRPVAATSIVVPIFRVTEERIAKWRELILGGAAEITSRLGAIAAREANIGSLIRKLPG
jgi:DNA-binding IclR family transcriptional regulator